jgi:hypothetical protein
MNKPYILVIFISIILFFAFIANTSANWLESQPTPENEKFAVVDRYNGCDVVQYTPTNSAKYYYFLQCSK